MTECLLKFCSAKARTAIQQQMLSHSRVGLSFSYDSMLNLALSIETDQEEPNDQFVALPSTALKAQSPSRGRIAKQREDRRPSPLPMISII